MVPPITWSLCVQRSVTGSGGRPVAAIVRRTLQLRKRRLIKVRRYLHQHEATLFRTGDRVVEQSTLLISATSNCRRPKHDDIVELAVLGTMNCHALPTTFTVT
ncbi:hypothetical protein X942_4736 [Burkholderia pseudomallei MSHR5596]|nr:hypothetical protein X942_4736 [Burkholderia pseudomallei MSHR5596]